VSNPNTVATKLERRGPRILLRPIFRRVHKLGCSKPKELSGFFLLNPPSRPECPVRWTENCYLWRVEIDKTAYTTYAVLQPLPPPPPPTLMPASKSRRIPRQPVFLYPDNKRSSVRRTLQPEDGVRLVSDKAQSRAAHLSLVPWHGHHAYVSRLGTNNEEGEAEELALQPRTLSLNESRAPLLSGACFFPRPSPHHNYVPRPGKLRTTQKATTPSNIK